MDEIAVIMGLITLVASNRPPRPVSTTAISILFVLTGLITNYHGGGANIIMNFEQSSICIIILNMLRPFMNMIGACWMRRSLGEPISALLIDSHHNVIAGGWNGQLTKWTAEGDELWSAKLPDRIGSIAFNDTGVYVTAGLHLVAINTENGEVFWQQALEGSADQVVIFQDF